MNWQDVPGDPGLIPTSRRGHSGPIVGAAWRKPPRFARNVALDRLLRELSDAYGPQRWWPAETPFEVIVGAVLVQNTAWSNVERALERAKQRFALTPATLLGLAPSALEDAIRPSGTYRSKAKKLAAISRWYLEAGGLRPLRSRPLGPLRDELLRVHGIGPETADAILCYAAGRRTPVVDTYARRVLQRHALIAPEMPYEQLRSWLLENLEDSLLALQEFHALVVRAGSEACRPSPLCEVCPATTPPPPRSQVRDA